jgi:transcriptional regulator with XRE-family HTH domain
MSVLAPAPGVGDLLRDWRRRRRLSQLDVSLDAAVSARHLSFVETGRSKPSRELVLHLAEHLDVPLRDRNALLLAAGYAPAYSETPLDDYTMAPVRAALDKILAGHAPFPAVIVDRRWDLVSANAPALALLGDGVAPELLEPPANAMRVCLHPDGLAPRIVNLPEFGAHLLTRLTRQSALAPDLGLSELIEELRAIGGRAGRSRRDRAGRPVVCAAPPAGTRHRAELLQHARDVRDRARRHGRGASDQVVLPGRPRDRGRVARPRPRLSRGRKDQRLRREAGR